MKNDLGEKKLLKPIGKKRIITHRGLENSSVNGFSESSYEAFQNQLSRGFGGIEFDPNPTRDGIIVMHDVTLKRPTEGKDDRKIANVTTAEIIRLPLPHGRISTFKEVIKLIRQNASMTNALHLKSRFQTPAMLERIMEALKPNEDIFPKLIIFNIKEETARTLKKTFPDLRLAPSIAHPYDIQRYNDSVGRTLMSIEDAIRLKSEGLIDGIWGDEWDTVGENGTKKIFYTKENFDRLHKNGLFIALATPELHGTSPGLYDGEFHSDAKDFSTLMKRIKQIKEAGADYFCTDYPEEVSLI